MVGAVRPHGASYPSAGECRTPKGARMAARAGLARLARQDQAGPKATPLRSGAALLRTRKGAIVETAMATDEVAGGNSGNTDRRLVLQPCGPYSGSHRKAAGPENGPCATKGQ